MKDPSKDYFRPWKLPDYLKLAGLVIGALSGIFLFTLPVGLVAVLVLWGLIFIWVPPSADEDSYLYDTRPFKLAQFFAAMKLKFKELRTPIVALGFGPPGPDPLHGFTDGDMWRPPYRLAAWWGLIAGIALGSIDYFINPILYPFWGGPYLQFGFVYWVLSIPGWFIVIQVVSHTFRWRVEPIGIVSAESAPATMINKVWGDISWKTVLNKAGIWSAIPLVVAGVLLVMTKVNYLWLLVPALFISLAIFFAMASRMMTRAYREQWYTENIKPTKDWDAVWTSVRPDFIPSYAGGQSLPTEEEWNSAYRDEGSYDPPLTLASFRFAANDSYAKLTKGYDLDPLHRAVTDTFATQDKPVSAVILAPIGNADPTKGEIPGTVGSIGFRVYYSTRRPDIRDIFDPGTDPRWREFVVRSTLMRALEKQVSGGTDFIYVKSSMITKNSPQNIAEVVLRPPNGISVEQILAKLDSIKGDLESVPWIRVALAESKRRISHTTNLSFFIGDQPDSDTTKYTHKQSGSKNRVEGANKAYILYKNGIHNKGAPPTLMEMDKVTDTVTESVFKMPVGLSTEKMRDKNLWKALGAASGNDYLEIRTSGEKMESGTFVINEAKVNPLSQIFVFDDYADELVPGRDWKQKYTDDPKKKTPKPWDARLKWGVGVFSNAQIGWDDFEKGAEPHLLIAGSSGSGKSVCLQSMIVQLAANNSPSDLNFWMCEPKIGLQRFKKLDVTTKFTDSWYPYSEFFVSVEEFMDQAVAEMLRRNELIAKVELDDGSVPEKLAQGREIAHKEGDSVDEYGNVTPHPLNIPYLILIIEECGTLFADAPTKEDQQRQKAILANAARIAREGRSAGVYMICTTQYPTNASIPSLIRNQMRRIGLACRSKFASEVVIDEGGLEDPSMRINKGSGMIMDGLNYRQLRMFWLQDGSGDDGANTIVDFLGGLPKNNIFDGGGSLAPLPGGKKAAGKSKSGKKSGSRPAVVDSLDFTVPAPSKNVLESWSNTSYQSDFEKGNIGGSLDNSINSDKSTKDITNDDYDDLINGVL